TPVAFFPDEGWVDVTQLTKILVERARQNGAELRFGTAVESIQREDRRVSGLCLSGGEVIPVDAVVNAAGPDTDLVAGLVGRELPLQSKNGLLVRVATKADVLGRLFHTPHVNLRPEGTRHVLLNHGSVDETLVAGEEERMSEKLLGHAREIVPSMAEAEIEEIRVGRRPIPADGVSCVGAVSGLPGYYEAVTHSGVTLGPLIGRLLTQEILTGEVDSLLAPFRPDRFD
ncbi:MAG: FAD-dependent oxidoreductase, partial [Rubrobacteraceae bacterium]